jgi:hypothetical protein
VSTFTFMQDYKTTTALAEVSREKAARAIRTELRRMVLAEDDVQIPDWTTLRVVGPFEVFDSEGNIRYEYRGMVHCPDKAEALAHTAAVLRPFSHLREVLLRRSA